MPKKKTRMIDQGAAPFLYLIALFCLNFMTLTGVCGSRSVYYVSGPFLAAGLFVITFLLGGSRVVREQVSTRISHGRITDAILFFESTVVGTFVFTAVIAILSLLLTKPLSNLLFGQRYSDLSIRIILIFLVLGSCIGPLKGFLDALGMRMFSLIGMAILGGGSFLLSVIFSATMKAKGSKIALLLRNDALSAVYGGAGAAIGFSIAAGIAFLWMLIIAAIVRRQLQKQEDTLRIDHDEHPIDMILFYLRQMLPYFAAFATLLICLWTEFRIGLSDAGKDRRGGFGISNWSGWMGGALPATVFSTVMSVLCFTRMPKLCARDVERGKRDALRLRFSMMMRLSAYISIPVSCFLFGAGKPIIQILHNGLDKSAKNAAVVTLKLGGGMVFLGCLTILFVMFLWRTNYSVIIWIAGVSAFVLHVICFYIALQIVPQKIEAVPVALTLFLLFFLLISYFLAKRRLLARTDTSFIGDFLRIMGAAIVASLPVILLNDFMTDEIIPVGGTVILLLIYVFVYALMSLWFQAADLRNKDKIPGGRYIHQLAVWMHIAS